MLRPARRTFWRSTRRRLSAGLTLFAYVVTAFGVPLPARGAAAGPCAGAACGCASTDNCTGGSCCCARPNPAPKPEANKACCSGEPGCTMPCCQHGEPSTECPHEAPPQPGDDPETPDPADDDATDLGVRWAIGIEAMKCRGHSTVWVTSGVVLPAPVPVTSRHTLEPAGWLRSIDDTAHSATHLSDDPPPRLMHV